MTVINDVKKTMAGLKTLQVSFETFALSTEYQPAKKLYQDVTQHTQTIICKFSPRIEQILQEEPQYNE